MKCRGHQPGNWHLTQKQRQSDLTLFLPAYAVQSINQSITFISGYEAHRNIIICQKHDNKIHDRNTNGGSPEKQVHQAGAHVMYSTKHRSHQRRQLKVKYLSAWK